MLTGALIFLINTAFGLFTIALVLRFYLQCVRASYRNPLSQFLNAITDFAVRPARRVIPELWGLDLSTRLDFISTADTYGGNSGSPAVTKELAIVGLHAIKERPMVVDGEIAVRKMMYLSVSFDHRMIDGAQAARFMSDLVRLVSNPKLLMVRL